MKPAFVPGVSNNIRFAGMNEPPRVELPVEVKIENNVGTFRSTWEPSPEERIAIAEGAQVEVTLYMISATHPPITVEISQHPREIPPLEWPKHRDGRDRSGDNL